MVNAIQAPSNIRHCTGFGIRASIKILLTGDRLDTMSARFPSTTHANAAARACSSVNPARSPNRNTAATAINNPSPWSKASVTLLTPNKRSPICLGGRCMMSCSASSASNTIAQAGLIIISRNTMWIGANTIWVPNSTGNITMPAIGTCTATT